MIQKEILSVVILGTFLIGGALLSQRFSDEIVRYLDFGVVGMLVYVIAGVLATVVAPVSTVALIPIAVALWGPLATALLSSFAWALGSMIAFLLARRFGRPLVARIISLEKISRYEAVLQGKQLFWNIAFLRMAVPVDILSYAIGLFTTVGFGTYAFATIIGVLPFAFIFAYASGASLPFQICAGVLVAIALYSGYRKVRKTRPLLKADGE